MALPVDNEKRRSLVLGAVVAVSVAIAALGVAVTRALAGAGVPDQNPYGGGEKRR